MRLPQWQAPEMPVRTNHFPMKILIDLSITIHLFICIIHINWGTYWGTSNFWTSLNLKSLLVQKLFHPFQSMFEGHVGLQPCNISFIKTPQANPPFELNLLSLTISPYPQWSQTVEPEAWAQWIPLRRMPRELFLSFRGTRQCGAEF